MTSLSWQPATLAWAALICAFIAIVHAIVSYRRVTTSAAPRTWIVGLALMRIVALLMLVLAAFQPTLQYVDRSDRRRPVVLIVDNSQSMGVIDASRSKGQLVRLAASLGQIDPKLRERTSGEVLQKLVDLQRQWTPLQEKARAYDDARIAGGDLVSARGAYAAIAGPMRATLTDLAATSASDTNLKPLVDRLTKSAESIEDPSKLTSTRQVIDALRNDVQKLDDQFDEKLAGADKVKPAVAALAGQTRMEIARELSKALASALEETAEPSIASLEASRVPIDTLRADGPTSTILQSLRQTIERTSGRDLEAIVLLSDGRSTESKQVVPPLVTAAGVPVFAVPMAPQDRAPDVRLARIDVPPTALRGETVAVAIRLRHRNAEGKQVKLTLTDGKQTQTRQVTLTAGGEQTERFLWKDAAPPSIDLKASIEPIVGETQQQNNAAEAAVPVVDQKLRVALLSGSAGWDLQYLRNILSRTPWIELSDQLIAPGEQCRLDADTLGKQDIFVLCDVPTGALSPQQADAIHRAVSERSKSALLLAGDSSVWRSMAQQPLLAALLPQRVDQSPAWRQTPAEEPSVLAVPAKDSGAFTPIALDDDPAESLRRWLARPQMFRVLSVGQLKPASRVLLQDRSTQSPVMVESVVGAGRSLSLLTNETWRWRREVGGEAHDRFWLDLVRHLMEPPYSATKDGISLGLDEQTIVAGNTLGLRVRRPVDFKTPITIELRREDQVIETLTPTELLPESGRLAAEFTPTQPGAYEVKLRAGDLSLGAGVLVLAPAESEMADTAPDLGLLTRIADSTGGAVISMDQALNLPERIAANRGQRDDTITRAIWCSPYVFCVIIGLLGLEWAIRKQLGLI